MYEKVFNTKLLGRAREFGRPSLSHDETDMLLTVGPTFGLKTLLAPLARWIQGKEWQCLTQIIGQRGLSLEDIQLFRAEEIRRDPLFEHAMRESLHPMMRELVRYRKQRYFKVDYGLKGFEAPDYIKEEARRRTFFKSLSNHITFRHFFKQNYQNDQTPQTIYIRTSMVVIELALLHGVCSRNAWSRYFWNEIHYYTIANFIEEERRSKQPSADLTTEAGWERFCRHASSVNKRFPGRFAPAGEEVDFEELKKDFQEIQAQTNWNRITASDLTEMGMRDRMSKEPFIQPKFEGEEAKGKSNIGLDMPTFLRKWTAKGFFN